MERYHINNIDENTLYSTQMIKTNWEFNDWSKEVLRRLSNEVYGAKPTYLPYKKWMEKYGKQDGLRATPILDEVHEYMKNDVKASYELYEEMCKLRELEKEAKKIGCRVVPENYLKSVNMPGIERVHFSGPCTIVIWDDGTKTMVRAQEGELFDPEKGLAMAISKKVLGNKGNYFDEFKKWIPEEKKEKLPDAVTDSLTAVREAGAEIAKGLEEAMKAYKKTAGELW